MAIRNLNRRPKRTFFLILGLAVANALTIWILTFRESSFHTLMDNILGMKYGKEQITMPGYYDFEKSSINPYRIISKNELTSFPETYTLRTQSVVLMASDANALPVLLNGYDLEGELKFSKINTVIDKNFKFKSKYPLILGKRLASALSVKPGQEIAMIGQATDGSVANELFTVELVLDLGGGEFEKNFAVTSLHGMQEFLVMSPDSVHIVANFGKPFENVPKKFETVKWQSLLPEIASSSGFMEKFTRFYAVFFALVASLAMANTLSLSFLERVKEYRMTTIIGAPVKWLKKTIRYEIFLITLSSLLLGNILITIVLGYFSIFPINLSILTGGLPLQMGGIVLTQDVRIQFELWVYIVSNVFFLITLTLASLYPIKVVMKKCQVS